MNANPGRPRLLRELNDRAALELLASAGALTRTQASEMTGLSKVTANHVLSRLEERGLVVKVGVQEGGRGPNAVLYGLNPSCGHVIAIEVYPDTTTAVLADITGRVLAEKDGRDRCRHGSGQSNTDDRGRPHPGRADGHGAGVRDSPSRRHRSRYEPYSVLLRDARRRGDVIEGIRQKLRLPVTIDNDVNLAAMAERAQGVASDVRDFVLVWIGRGPGSAVMVGDQLLRGTAARPVNSARCPFPART